MTTSTTKKPTSTTSIVEVDGVKIAEVEHIDLAEPAEASAPRKTRAKASTSSAEAPTAKAEVPVPDEIIQQLTAACAEYQRGDRASVVQRQRSIYDALDAGATAKQIAALAGCTPGYILGLSQQRSKVEAGWAKPIREPGAAKTTRYEQGRQDVIAALLEAFAGGKGSADMLDVFEDMLSDEQRQRFAAAVTK
jgi:hypothetical protein